MNSNNKEHYLLKKAFEIIERDGWEKFSLQNLSKQEKIKNEDIKFYFKNKNEIIDKFSTMMDSIVESKVNLDDFKISSKKDNLFELIMLRLEEMKNFKISLVKIIESAKKKPLLLKRISSNVMNTLDFYLELTSCYENTPIDFLKQNTLFFIYSFTFKTWLKDESDDLSSTMAELDRLLTFSEKAEKKIKNFFPI
ncbi:MAG: hypothetical protein CL572_03445 [Alphaproteobacteria bacterium]|nr:hypothetical protein [Alphaproteobacteria bacterium]